MEPMDQGSNGSTTPNALFLPPQGKPLNADILFIRVIKRLRWLTGGLVAPVTLILEA
jgi:hypothetical protein